MKQTETKINLTMPARDIITITCTLEVVIDELQPTTSRGKTLADDLLRIHKYLVNEVNSQVLAQMGKSN